MLSIFDDLALKMVLLLASLSSELTRLSLLRALDGTVGLDLLSLRDYPPLRQMLLIVPSAL